MIATRFARVVTIAVAAVSAFATACGGVPDDVSETGSGASTAADGEQCSAVFRWLQHDAYKSTGGRSTELWPPHTTTVVDVTCTPLGGAPQRVLRASMENHGALPDARDANGDLVLDEVKRSEPLRASRRELLRLVDALGTCTCDTATAPLAVDAQPDDVTRRIWAEASAYVAAHLTCDEGTTPADVAAKIREGEFDGAVARFSSCAWKPGYALQEGLSGAANRVFETMQTKSGRFHSSNNDAQLQAQLWSLFAETGVVKACTSADALCRGASWNYKP